MTQSYKTILLAFALGLSSTFSLSGADGAATPLPPLEFRAVEPSTHVSGVDVQKIQTQIAAPQPAGTGGPLLSLAGKALGESEEHFQEGKSLLQEQRVDEARREFDQAVDVLLNVPENVPDRSLFERQAEEIIRRIHKYDLESLGAGQSPEGLFFTQSPRDDLLDMTFPVDPRLKGRVLESIRASSSQLPLEVNDAVLSYINYFSSPRGQRIFSYGWKRAGRYRPMIERVFREEGLPSELIHLAQAESGFMPRALSVKACAGMWQFGRQTGGLYGLEATKLLDDRLDPEKATRAAARHLHDLYRRTGDWYLAMAGYDCGPLCVERAVQRTGFADYWELRRRNALPRETQNYVPAILAMVIIAKDPAAYGIPVVDQDPELAFDTVRLSAPTQLALLADAADASVSDLRDLNPSVLKNVAPAGSEVRVPTGRSRAVLAALEAVPADKRASWRLHRVSAGDTLPQIVRRYGATPPAILAANRDLGAAWFENPRVGDLVLVPLAPRAAAVTKTARRSSAQNKPAGSTTVAARRHRSKAAGRAKSAPRGTQLASAARPQGRRPAAR
jgi:membrane-bound lytic murein transglycosylase D